MLILQVGMEKLESYLKSQPMPNFLAGGRLPATVAETRSFSRSEMQYSGRVGVDVNVPGNMDLGRSGS